MIPEVEAGAGRIGRVLLAADGLGKSYPGVVALDGVRFEVRAGEVHALMGQNGAGKSTLVKILTGAAAPDTGRMTLEGRRYDPRTPLEAQRLGVSAVYQEVNLIPTLSVMENLFLGRQPRRWWGVDWPAMRRQALGAMATLGIAVDVERPLGSLPLATQQMVAIARAVDSDARVLVLDEPTSSLDRRECEQLFAIMARLKARGLGLVFITHFVEQVYRVADRITVLRGGRRIGTFDAAALSRAELVGHMLGKQAGAGDDTNRERESPPCEGKPVLRVRGVARRGVMGNVNLDVGRGEVVGLAGLLGSGRTETAGLVFGDLKPDRGAGVECGGRRLRPGSPRDAIAAGLGLSPEDRKTDGLFLSMSVRDNIALVVQRKLGWRSRWGLLSRRDHGRIAERFVGRLGITTTGVQSAAGTLSGGNQQKVLLARWLANRPSVLILDEPTRGVDIGGKAQIEAIVRDLSRGEDAMAMLFISAELDEVVRRCDRVLVLRDREVVGELRGEQVTEGAIMRLVAG